MLKGDEVFLVDENESVYINIGELHALENPGEKLLEIIEVQTGSYLGDDDIERFDDLVIDDVSKQALINRCYVVKDRIELRDILVRYKEQGLPSKWSKDFVDQYVYPIDKGNPGINIANYIRAL